MTYNDIIERAVTDKAEGLQSAANEIWSFAEIRYEEYKSAALLADILEAEGFSVERQAGGIETAFVASYGRGQPVVAILGEFDALPNLSQEGDVAGYKPVVPGGNGHADDGGAEQRRQHLDRGGRIQCQHVAVEAQ